MSKFSVASAMFSALISLSAHGKNSVEITCQVKGYEVVLNQQPNALYSVNLRCKEFLDNLFPQSYGITNFPSPNIDHHVMTSIAAYNTSNKDLLKRIQETDDFTPFMVQENPGKLTTIVKIANRDATMITESSKLPELPNNRLSPDETLTISGSRFIDILVSNRIEGSTTSGYRFGLRSDTFLINGENGQNNIYLDFLYTPFLNERGVPVLPKMVPISMARLGGELAEQIFEKLKAGGAHVINTTSYSYGKRVDFETIAGVNEGKTWGGYEDQCEKSIRKNSTTYSCRFGQPVTKIAVVKNHNTF